MLPDPDTSPTSPSAAALRLLEVAHAAVDAALAEVTRRPPGRLRTALATKSTSTDLVTEFDQAAEAAIRRVLEQRRPDDGIIGEEGHDRASRSGLWWVVDPIDGTTNFVYDHPHYAVSVAVEDTEGGVAGVVADVTTGERYWASRGGGSFLDGTRLTLDTPPPLAHALVATGFGYSAELRHRQATILAAILPGVRDIRRLGAAALDLCSVASGRVDAYYEFGIAHWDHAAGALIATEAGARVDVIGGESSRTGTIVAAHPDLHDRLVERLAHAGDTTNFGM